MTASISGSHTNVTLQRPVRLKNVLEATLTMVEKKLAWVNILPYASRNRPFQYRRKSMKNLVIYAHPNEKSFCAALKDLVVATSSEKKLDVELRDLYQLGFNPVLSSADFVALNSGKLPQDIVQEQSYIQQAEIITFIYPIWWTGLPAMVKGYIDRVFSYGFAYKVGEKGIEGLLKGKKVIVFNTTGTPHDVYEKTGMIEAMKKTSDTGIFAFCGMTVIQHRFFGAVPYVDDAARKGYLEDAKRCLMSL